jgi:hypothetical protein
MMARYATTGVVLSLRDSRLLGKAFITARSASRFLVNVYMGELMSGRYRKAETAQGTFRESGRVKLPCWAEERFGHVRRRDDVFCSEPSPDFVLLMLV